MVLPISLGAGQQFTTGQGLNSLGPNATVTPAVLQYIMDQLGLTGSSNVSNTIAQPASIGGGQTFNPARDTPAGIDLAQILPLLGGISGGGAEGVGGSPSGGGTSETGVSGEPGGGTGMQDAANVLGQALAAIATAATPLGGIIGLLANAQNPNSMQNQAFNALNISNPLASLANAVFGSGISAGQQSSDATASALQGTSTAESASQGGIVGGSQPGSAGYGTSPGDPGYAGGSLVGASGLEGGAAGVGGGVSGADVGGSAGYGESAGDPGYGGGGSASGGDAGDAGSASGGPAGGET